MASTTETITDLREQKESLASRLRGMKRVAERGMETAVNGFVAVTTGALLGVARAYNDDDPGKMPEFGELPLSFLAGIGLHAAAMTTNKEGLVGNFQTAGNVALGIASCDFTAKKVQEWREEEDAGKGSAPRRVADRLRGAAESALDSFDKRTSGGMSRLPVNGYE